MSEENGLSTESNQEATNTPKSTLTSGKSGDGSLYGQEIHDWRKAYLNRFWWFLCAWSIVSLVFVGLAALSPVTDSWGIGPVRLYTKSFSFEISDSVAIALLTTSLGHAVGLMIVAARWLFPKRD